MYITCKTIIGHAFPAVVAALTFEQPPLRLSVGEDGLDVDAHGSLGAVLAAHDGEAEALVPGALLERHGLDAEVLRGAAAAGERAELGRRLVEEKEEEKGRRYFTAKTN